MNLAYSNYFSYQILAQIDNFDFLDQICPKKAFYKEECFPVVTWNKKH